MKILHTSDWHLGHLLYEYDRTEEHQAFLNQFKEIIYEEKPDAVVVCGDVFDKTTPPVAARDMFVRVLLDIRKQNPATQIIVTAGNHDGKSTFEVEGKIWEQLNVKMIAQVERLADGTLNLDKHIIEIKDAAESPCGYVIAVPHIYEYGYPQVDGAEGASERQRTFFQSLLDATEARNRKQLPIVLTAHLAMTGSDFQGHDFYNSYDTIGGVETVNREQLGSGYDYLALGHIHKKQDFLMENTLRARYCGTPIAVSFDEPNAHSVSIVNVERGKAPIVREIEIHNIKSLLTIPENPKSFDEAVEVLREKVENYDEPSYVRINVLDDGLIPANYLECVIQILKGKKSKYCCLLKNKPKRNNEATESLSEQYYDTDNLPSAKELAHIYYKRKFTCDLDEDLLPLLEEAIRKTEEESESE